MALQLVCCAHQRVMLFPTHHEARRQQPRATSALAWLGGGMGRRDGGVAGRNVACPYSLSSSSSSLPLSLFFSLSLSSTPRHNHTGNATQSMSIPFPRCPRESKCRIELNYTAGREPEGHLVNAGNPCPLTTSHAH